MSPELRKVNIYVTAEQWQQLHAIRELTGAPVSESVRRAINDYVARHLKPEKASTAAKEDLADGPPKRKKSR
jgi:hypothetical protein